MSELKTLAEYVTPGPWYACTWDPMEVPHVSPIGGQHHPNSDIAQQLTIANANYIAALSPDVVLRLIAIEEAAHQAMQHSKNRWDNCTPNSGCSIAALKAALDANAQITTVERIG